MHVFRDNTKRVPGGGKNQRRTFDQRQPWSGVVVAAGPMQFLTPGPGFDIFHGSVMRYV